MEAELFTFGPEFVQVEATDIDSDLRHEMMEIQITVMDVKLQGQMEKHQIIQYAFFVNSFIVEKLEFKIFRTLNIYRPSKSKWSLEFGKKINKFFCRLPHK